LPVNRNLLPVTPSVKVNSPLGSGLSLTQPVSVEGALSFSFDDDFGVCALATTDASTAITNAAATDLCIAILPLRQS
jgi:hypothetical protein